MRVPVNGGLLSTLAKNQDTPFAIAVNSASVYWANAGDSNGTNTGNIMVVALADGSASVVGTGGQYAASLALDSSNLYWSGAGGELWQMPLAGGAATSRAFSAQSYSGGITVSGGSVFWESCGSIGTMSNLCNIQQIDLSTGAIEDTIDGLSSFTSICVSTSGLAVYYNDFTATSARVIDDADGVLSIGLSDWHAPYAGYGEFGTLAAGLAIDANNVVYAIDNYGGNIVEFNGSGGTLIATGQSYPLDIAVDTANVYWTNNVDGTVMQIAK